MRLQLPEHKEAIQEIVDKIGDDGHGLFKPSLFEKVPEEWLKDSVRAFESDGTGKGSIFRDGKVLNKVTGIYSLDILGRVVNDLHLKAESMMGRGFQARAYTKAIREALTSC